MHCLQEWKSKGPRTKVGDVEAMMQRIEIDNIIIIDRIIRLIWKDWQNIIIMILEQ